MDNKVDTPAAATAQPRIPIIWDILLIGVLLIGAFFRLVGLNWDEYTHMHPDERFLTMVATSLQPVENLGQYFDTATSTLNPNNRGYGFYVYGTLPMFIVRYVGEWVEQTGYDQIHLVGRQLSALFDLGTVFLVYLIALRLYRRQRLALLASLFYALAVLPIQLSHYFKEDTFMTFFATLTVYFAVRLLPLDGDDPPLTERERERGVDWLSSRWLSFFPYLFFGIALGMTVASKVIVAPIAIMLPAAALIRYLRADREARARLLGVYLRNLALAGVVALIVFRVFQPYAFEGPGFLGVGLNQKWLDTMREVASQNSGDVDFPPQLQWARRPIWFGLQNIVQWGLGLPLGILAWAGFLWMGWKIIRGEWTRHSLLWGWCAVYTAWQSSSATPSMRYFMPVYPLLVIFAAWAIFAVWDAASQKSTRVQWGKVVSILLGLGVSAGTMIWALAFVQIYIRPFTRVEASRWIYQNVPGPINLQLSGEAGDSVRLLAMRYGYTLQPDQVTNIAFVARESGRLTAIKFPHVKNTQSDSQSASLVALVSDNLSAQNPMAYTVVDSTFSTEGDPRGSAYTGELDRPLELVAGQRYYLHLQVGGGVPLELAGAPSLLMASGEVPFEQALPEAVNALRSSQSLIQRFVLPNAADLKGVWFEHVLDWEATPDVKSLAVLIRDPESGSILGETALSGAFGPGADYRGAGHGVTFGTPIHLDAQKDYELVVEFREGGGLLAIYGSKQALETSWDDALPLGVDRYDPYDYYTGVFRSDLNFEMYWDDNQEKRERFQSVLDQADYLFISSNRQWGTTVRVPERYPMTAQYYRSLIGCPEEREITWCYSVAEPGTFKGALGFDLVKVVQSNPRFGPFEFNTQFAEEAFTVYDHPKVLIFKKNASYRSQDVRALLNSVDLSLVVHLTPGKASKYPGNLLLPADRLAQQQAGGTWAELFDREALQNRYPGLGVVTWYLAISLLGWLVFPLVRLALRGLPDRGYPFARLSSMLLLAYPVWLAGSVGIPFSRTTINVAVVGLVALGIVLGWVQRKQILSDLRQNWRYYLLVELIGLAFFLLFLFVRLGNPDLWHAWKGGEKPMDFSYFNAVLKSTSFPPYDPWFAGGYINYYYYGFVLVGVPVKWLGIVPAIAYNIILPQLYSLLALGAFSVVWNILVAARRERESESRPYHPYLGAMLGPIFMGVLGNLGSIRMIWHGLMRLAAPDGAFAAGNIFQKIGWTIGGLGRYVSGVPLPYPPGDWYWIPSRAFPNEPITEFPAFTFLYADLHAHMIALPITVLVIGWGLSILIGRWTWGLEGGRLKGAHFIASFFLGAVAIGALRPTNTWDFPTYLALASVAILFSVFRFARVDWLRWELPEWLKRGMLGAACVAMLAILSLVLYQPFTRWFGQGYSAVDFWKGDHTPWWSYITHWGVFLWMIITWLVWETRDWMATTPLSALNKLRPHVGWIYGLVAGLVALVAVLLVLNVRVGWFTLPLAAWAGVLLFRPKTPSVKRAVLFFIGTGLVLTLMVELIVLRGDIGRMNTVFKFSLQAWTILSLSAAAALAWTFPSIESQWSRSWRNGWSLVSAVLIGCAALFPLLGGADKIRDRMSVRAPHSLDGMAYMQTATFNESGVDMDLSQDYRAIRWVQENIQGSPVIVEGHTTEYRWGNRFTIYTGLPSVVGWNWHQRQQRALTPENWVTDRVQAIADFYSTFNREQTVEFLQKYNVSYIVVGVMERVLYPMDGLAKFDIWNGDMWNAVYQDGETVIYQVNR